MTLSDEYFLGTKLYHKKFAELITPIANFLGITNAIYINIDKHGRMFSICDMPNWVERVLENHYYNLDPFMVHPNNIHNGFAFDKSYPDQEFEDVFLYDAVVNFKLCHSFVYTEKTSDNGYIGFGFATTKNNGAIINRLLMESLIIKKLIRDLNKKLTFIINKDLKENRMDFAHLKGSLFKTQKGLVFNPEHEHQHKIELLKEAGLLQNNDETCFLTNAYFSPQEINCLKLYLTTRSIKKIARELSLAVTTVAGYIENIKCKLNCSNKNQLLEKAEVLESLGRI